MTGYRPPEKDNLIFRCHAVAKLAILIIIIAALLIKGNALTYLGVSAFLFIVVLLAGISFPDLLRKIKPLCYFLIFIALFHLLFTPGNSIPPFPVWKIDVTWEGLRNGGSLAYRFLLLIVASSVLTLTTPPVELARGLQTLFYPFGWIGLPVSRFSKMMVLTLQFIPVVFSEGENAIKEVKKSRADFASLSLFGKIPLLASVVEIIFEKSLEYAEELAGENDRKHE